MEPAAGTEDEPAVVKRTGSGALTEDLLRLRSLYSAADRSPGGKSPLSGKVVPAVDPKELSQKSFAKRAKSFEKAAVQDYAPKEHSWRQTFYLAYLTIGTIYGDIGTSPLYTVSGILTTLPDAPVEADLLGAGSLIFWTLTLVPLLKYIFVVMYADDCGEGGTFALYSSLCRHAKISLLGSRVNEEVKEQLAADYDALSGTASALGDEEANAGRHRMDDSAARGDNQGNPTKPLVKSGDSEVAPPETSGHWLSKYLPRGSARWSRKIVEKYWGIRQFLLLLTLLGTCGVLSDGVLTPSVSILSAIGGLSSGNVNLTQGQVVAVTCAILVALFLFQRFGTEKVAFTFSPIVLIWFCFISSIGVYNIAKYKPGIFECLNPYYSFDFLVRNKTTGWIALGQVILCITGTEALFADMGHFNRRAIQLGFTCVLYPSVLLSYFGQIAFVSVYPDQVPTAFYGSIPPSLFWPQFIFATLAAIVASQAMITGAFSIIKQSMALSCFPRVQIIHTSTTHEGQIYVPTVNYILLVLTIAVTAGFGNGTSIGNAYGVTVLMVMTLTTTLVSIVMLVSWDLSIWVVLPFFLFYFGLDSVFFSSTLYKVPQGGWFPLAMAGCLLCIMYTWHFGTYKKRHYAREHEVSEQSLALLLERCTPIDGVAVVYNDYGEGTVPPALVHYLSNIPSMQRVVVCLTVSQLPVPKLDDARRLLVENMSCNGKPIPGFFRAVVYYGYTEMWDHGRDFLDGLYARIMECAKLSDEPRRREAQRRTEGGVTLEVGAAGAGRPVEGSVQGEETEESVVALGEGGDIDEEINTWLYRDAPEAYTGNQLLDAAWAYNQVYFMGRTSLVPAENARMTTKLLVPAYGLLRAIFNTQAAALKVPTDRLLEVGMVYTAT